MVRPTEQAVLGAAFATLLSVWSAPADSAPPGTGLSYAAARAIAESAVSQFPPAAGHLQLMKFQLEARGPAEMDIASCVVTKVSVYTVLSQLRISCGDVVYSISLSALRPAYSYSEDGKAFLRLTQAPLNAYAPNTPPAYGLGDDDKTWRDNRTAPYYTSLSNALGVLKSGGQPLPDDAQFATVASAYRASTAKPALPEDALRYQQQADAAYSTGRFLEAAEGYERALETAPWWPGAYRGLALSLADAHQYTLAIADMQRYLALAPDAPDASDEQERIDRWKSMPPQARTPNR